MTERRRGEFARLLRRHRLATGRTQRELAAGAGLGERTISDLERGVATAPYDDTVRRLVGVLSLAGAPAAAFHAAARSARDAGPRAPMVRRLLEATAGRDLIARETELGRLLELLSQLEGGAGHTVLVGGEAGVGKTRLVLELCRHALARGVQVTIGRCYDGQGSAPLTPVAEALSALYAASSADLRAAARERWPQLARVLPEMSPRPGPGGDGPGEIVQVFRAVGDFVRAAAAEAPVLLIVEDLHWADRASLDLLLHLARNTRADPVLIIGTFRDVDVGRRHPLRPVLRDLHREPTTIRLELDNLSEQGTAALVGGCWNADNSPGLPPSLVAQMYRRTDGNPFFVVELVADLLDRLTRTGGADVDLSREPPATVAEAVLGRVARLGPSTQALLDVACVLGPGDAEDLIAIASLAGVEHLDPALDEAEDTGLLRAVADQLSFDHSLTQEALYADLSLTRRRRLHRDVAVVLEGRPHYARRGRAGEIARHFRLAGDPVRALPHTMAAGQQAEGLFAYAEAEQHYRAALELAEQADPALIPAASERLGAVLAAQARYDDGWQALARAVAGYRARGDTAGVDRTEADIALAGFRAGTPARGIARLTRHLQSEPATDPGRRRGLAGLHLSLARLYYANGEYRDCRDAAERGARLCRTDDDVSLLAGIELWRGIGLLWSDAPDGGVTALTHALSLADAHGLLDLAGTACLPLFLAHALRAEFDRAQHYAEHGISAAERTGDLALLAMHIANRGAQWVHRGDWAAAGTDLVRAVGLADDLADAYFAPLPAAYLGVLRLAEGRLEEAAEQLSASVDRSSQVGNREVLGFARTQLLRLELLRGHPDLVVARLGSDPDLSGVTWWYDVVLLTVLAEGLLATDRAPEAEPVAARAVERARRMRNLVDGAAAEDVQDRIRHRLGKTLG